MAGRGAPTFQKRQKEQQRKEKQQQKLARRAERKLRGDTGVEEDDTENPLDAIDHTGLLNSDLRTDEPSSPSANSPSSAKP